MAKTRKTSRVFMRLDFGGFYVTIDVQLSLNECHCHRDFLLKPELLRAISDLGFEHPSEGRARSEDPQIVLSLTVLFRSQYNRNASHKPF